MRLAKVLAVLIPIAACACSKGGPQKERLAVGALWNPDADERCDLVSSDPSEAIKAERWPKPMSGGDELVAQVLGEGRAVVTCEQISYALELVDPASIQVHLADPPTKQTGDKETELLALISIAKTGKDGKPIDTGTGLRLEGVKWSVTGSLKLVDRDGNEVESDVGKDLAHVKVKSDGAGSLKAEWRGLSSELTLIGRRRER